MKVEAIIPAAGSGTRMGTAVPKQFLTLRGKPVLYYSLHTLAQCALVDSVILVVPARDVDAARAEWVEKRGLVRTVIAGGEQRQDSVYNGFMALQEDTRIVVVHDGVRPFITGEMISHAVQGAQNHGAAITAIPVSDTIKAAGADGMVERTLDRNGLWRVQTPQAFQKDLLGEAFAKAKAAGFYATDEGGLIEFLGKKVKLVPGSELNIKITRKDDFLLGEGIAARGPSEDS